MTTHDQDMNKPLEGENKDVSYPETPLSKDTKGTPFVQKRISWGAIFAGGFVALVVLATLNLLGIGIGAAAFDSTGEAQPFEGYGIGAGIWWTISFLIALFVGGFVAGRLAGATDRYESLIHGLVTWGFVALASMFFVMSAAGQIIGGAMGVVGQGITAATDVPMISEQLQAQLEQAGVTEQQINEAQTALAQAGDEVATTVSAAAFGAFIALLLGGLLAGVGSTLGAYTVVTGDLRTRRQRRREYVPGRVRHA